MWMCLLPLHSVLDLEAISNTKADNVACPACKNVKISHHFENLLHKLKALNLFYYSLALLVISPFYAQSLCG